MDKKKLIKHLRKLYMKNNQVLYFTCMEYQEEELKFGCCCDLVLWDNKKKKMDRFLPVVSTYDIFIYHDSSPVMGVNIEKEYLRDGKLITTFDSVKASCTPYWDGENFLIQRTGDLKLKDLMKAVKYYMKKVLEMDWYIWNYAFVDSERKLIYYSENDKREMK